MMSKCIFHFIFTSYHLGLITIKQVLRLFPLRLFDESFFILVDMPSVLNYGNWKKLEIVEDDGITNVYGNKKIPHHVIAGQFPSNFHVRLPFMMPLRANVGGTLFEQHHIFLIFCSKHQYLFIIFLQVKWITILF